MVAPSRPRRSMLYMPASNPRALEKAKTIPADGIIFDLEDAVAPDQKPVARSAAVTAVKSKSYGKREVLIRVNALETQWCADDVAAAATSGADAIVLPKVNNARELQEVAKMLDRAAAPPTLLIWAMAETPRGVLADCIETLARADRSGLDPADYDASSLSARWAALKAAPPSAVDAFSLSLIHI